MSQLVKRSSQTRALVPRIIANPRRRIRPIALVVALGLILIAVQFLRVGVSLFRIREHATALIDSSHSTDEKESQEAAALLADYRQLRSALGFLPNLGPLFGWAPRYGGDLAAAPQLLTLGDALADTADPSLAIFNAFIENSKHGDPPITAIIRVAQEKPPLIAQARDALKRAREVRSQIDISPFSPEVKQGMTLLDEMLPAWSGALALLERTPVLLGADRPRNYLILAQNSDELRATGGFISGVGLLSVDKGQVAVKDFGDSYSVDNLTATHPPPPEALQKYMTAGLWVIRDANWYANFPTTAQVAKSLYELDKGVATDGVIAVDLHLMPLLLRAFGVLRVPSTGDQVTGDNVLAKFEARWNPPPEGPQSAEWWSHRKDFMGQVLDAMMNRVRNGDFERTPLVLAFFQGLRSKNMLIYFDDEEANNALQESNWAGTVVESPGDQLLVVDSNVGFNKVNTNLSQAITYTVSLKPEGGDAQVDISYRSKAKPSNEECLHKPYYGKTYGDLRERCYWDYVRVLAPKDSEFVSAEGVQDGGVTDDVSAVTAFQGYFVLKRGASQRVSFNYRLPARVVQGNSYQLILQKQAGQQTLPVRVKVQLPVGWEAASTNIEPTRRADSSLDFDLALDHDITLNIKLNKTRSFPLLPIVGIGLILLGVGALVLFSATRRPKSKALTITRIPQ